MTRELVTVIAMLVVLVESSTWVYGQPARAATIEPARLQQCPADAATCREYDAIVFVHGIYGAAETFRNTSTGFDWPTKFPASVDGRDVDVFRLNYQTALLSWSMERNPEFTEVARATLEALGPLRK